MPFALTNHLKNDRNDWPSRWPPKPSILLKCKLHNESYQIRCKSSWGCWPSPWPNHAHCHKRYYEAKHKGCYGRYTKAKLQFWPNISFRLGLHLMQWSPNTINQHQKDCNPSIKKGFREKEYQKICQSGACWDNVNDTPGLGVWYSKFTNWSKLGLVKQVKLKPIQLHRQRKK